MNIEFESTTYTYKDLVFDYCKLIELFGINWAIGILKKEEQSENYEECQKIKDAIDYHNNLVTDQLLTNR